MVFDRECFLTGSWVGSGQVSQCHVISVTRVTWTPWTLKAILEFILTSITGLFNFCISVNSDQIYKLTPQLSISRLWGCGRERTGVKTRMGTNARACQQCPFLHLCTCFHTFPLDTLKRVGVQNSYLKGLGRPEVANISSKIHNNPCNLKIISRRCHDTILRLTFKNSEHSFQTCECVQKHHQL